MTQEKEREAFEKWVSDGVSWLEAPRPSDGYALPEINAAWRAWQARAALEAKQVEVPHFNPAAKRKLDMLLGDGANITGYAFQKADGRHGSIDCHGFVQWRTEQSDHIEQHLEMVKMPDPVAYICPRRADVVMPDSFLLDASFDGLYTEHQLRTLLAQHGIKIAD